MAVWCGTPSTSTMWPASSPVERDHEAMYRALAARKEQAGKHGGTSAWRYPNYELGLRLEMQLRNELEARTERLKEEARKLQFVRNKLR